MQVKDILKDCLRKLRVEDFTTKLILSDDESALQARLLNCLNLIYQEVATNFLFLSFKEQVDLNGETLEYGLLTYRILRPLKLIAQNKSIAFTALPSGLKTSYIGRAELHYNYLPEDLSIDSTIDDYRLTSGILSNGVLGEYYFLENLFDLAAAYDSKFRSDLSWATTRGREIKIKQRSWK